MSLDMTENKFQQDRKWLRELELISHFKQKSQEGVTAWVLQWWDIEADGMLDGSEMLKMTSATAQPALLQRLYIAGMGECLAKLINWINSTIKMTWPNEGDVPSPPCTGPLWKDYKILYENWEWNMPFTLNILEDQIIIFLSFERPYLTQPWGMVWDFSICPCTYE